MAGGAAMNLLEFSLRFKGFDIDKAGKSLAEYAGHQLERRDAIVKYHLEHNSFYRRLVGDRPVDIFEQLPIINKTDFQRPLHEMISDGYRPKDLYVANTSGSSGHPFYFAKDKDAHAITHSIILDLYNEHGITPDLLQARFYGIPLKGLAAYKERLKDFLSNRLRFHVFDLSDTQLERYLNTFSRKKFGYIYGYTSAVVQFAKFLLRKGIVLNTVCPTLRSCIITSEVCTAQDRTIMEEAFGVKVINEYGCSEAGLIAFEDREGSWKMVTADSYYEVVDEEGKVLPYGCEGRLLITSLSNKAMPFIRYEVGDLGVINQINGELILEKLTGRVSDMVILPSGKRAAGLTFYYISRAVLEKSDAVREFIVRQTAIDTFIFDMVSQRNLTKAETTFLQKQMDDYLEPGLKLVINRVDKIERPASGKIKHFYSQLK